MCDEEQLLIGARQFDRTALARIHDRYYGQIYRYARYRTGDDQTAQDTASEVFLRLLDALQEGQAPHQSLRGWLFSTANHVVNDHFRRHYRVELQDLAEHEAVLATDQANPEHQLLLSLTHEQLRSALSRLTPEQQHVITLRFGHGLSHRETAHILNKSEGAVKLLQFRALRALRRLLEPRTGRTVGDDRNG